MSKIINQNLAFCGLCCPHCYRVKVSNAAKMLKHEMDVAAGKGAKYLDEVSESFSSDIDVLISKECNLYCRAGGGSTCKIKLCCFDKKLNGCWECNDFETCEKISAQFKGHCRDIREKGLDAYIEGYS
jgi:hypothetical protein